MQVLWREALEGNRPITVDEFLYCYKPSEIKKSAGFYQFSSRSSYYNLIKGRSSSDRFWKQEFFIVSGKWAGDPAVVGSPSFQLISLRISGLDDLASVELPTVVEGLQRTKCCQRGDRR